MALPKPPRAPAAAPEPHVEGRPPAGSGGTFQLGAPHATRAPDPPLPAPKGPRLVALRVALAGVIAYAVGWYASFYGVLPGVFLASDIGLPFLLLATLRGILRITQGGIRDTQFAKVGASFPRAAGWAIGIYWVLATVTNVLQLAIGISGGILLYTGYMLRGKIARLGYSGYGPAFGPTLVTVVAYAGWQAARVVLGPLPGFDAMSAAAAFLAAFGILHATRNAVKASNQERRLTVAEIAAKRNPNLERKTLVAVIVGYVFFRIFISEQIPYGPIVEWFLICIGVLFFAIAAADRIGTVPTRRSLPDPEKRTHIQRVSSLPDRHLADTQTRLTAFIERGADLDGLHVHFSRLMEDSGMSATEIASRLAPFQRTPTRRGAGHAPVESMGLEARNRLLADLVRAMRTARVPTGTLKAGPTVHTPGASRTPSRA